jgi:steroid delta-isomerase-like uncharacterized protein
MATILIACEREKVSNEQINIQNAERLLTEVWSGGHVEILDEIIGDNYVKHWAMFEPIVGRDQLKQEVLTWRSSFPDCKYEIHAIKAFEDMVFVRYTETGTFTSNFFDLPANGKAIRAAGTVWLRFDGGRIVEDWSMSDEWAIQTQLETDFPNDWFFPGWD